MARSMGVDVQKHAGQDVWEEDGEVPVDAEECVDVPGGCEVLCDFQEELVRKTIGVLEGGRWYRTGREEYTALAHSGVGSARPRKARLQRRVSMKGSPLLAVRGVRGCIRSRDGNGDG